MNDIYNLCSVIPLGDKSLSLRRIHFAEKIIEQYIESVSEDLKRKVCATALLNAVMEDGYTTAYLASEPTKENVAKRMKNRAPSFFDEELESEDDIVQDMVEESCTYNEYKNRSYYSYKLLVSLFDKEMADLYNDLYAQLTTAFEQTEEKHDDWNNYALV